MFKLFDLNWAAELSEWDFWWTCDNLGMFQAILFASDFNKWLMEGSEQRVQCCAMQLQVATLSPRWPTLLNWPQGHRQGICSPGCGYQLSFSWTKSVVRCSLQSVTNLSFGHFWLLEIPAYMNYYFILDNSDGFFLYNCGNKQRPAKGEKQRLFYSELAIEVSLCLTEE